MVQVVIMIVFFVALAVGGVVADQLGRLPTAEQLAEEDQARFSRLEHEF
jgi:hypothetical protein